VCKHRAERKGTLKLTHIQFHLLLQIKIYLLHVSYRTNVKDLELQQKRNVKMCYPDGLFLLLQAKVHGLKRISLRLINQVTTLGPTNCITLFPGVLHYSITLNTSTCFNPRGIIIRESKQHRRSFNLIL
jgi:hypothetical protein